jgi:competence protein ComEC
VWRIGIAFLAGHCVIHLLPVLPQPHPWAWALGVAAAIALCMRSALLSMLCLGIAWTWIHAAARLADDLPAYLEGEDLVVVGVIASIPNLRGDDAQFALDVQQARAGVPKRIRLTWYDADVQPRAGERWRLVVRLKRRNGFANPGGFDYEGYLFREGIGAIGYVRQDVRNERVAAASMSYPVLRARAWIAARMAAAVSDPDMLGILQGLAVGDAQAMSPEQWRVFAATGTTHLMAISGLHISMLSAIAAWLGGGMVLLRGAQAKRLNVIHGRALAGSMAAVAYSFLAGLSVPTQRTMVMLCVYFAARASRRELNAGHALGWALIGVLLVDPFAPLAVGAWLSFAAVAVILLTVSGRLRQDGTLVAFGRVQGAVTIGLTPVLIGAFGSISLVSPVANAFVIPLFTLIVVPLVLLGTLLSSLSLTLGGWILDLVTWLLEACWPALEWLAGLPWALWYAPDLGHAAVAALIAGSVMLVLPGIWPLRWVAVALCLPTFIQQPHLPAPGTFDVSVLDVGQGLAVVVRTRSRTLVYDAGPAFQSGRDTGELVILPFLRHRGVRRIDVLVVSHSDLDHRGGMHSLLNGMPTARLMVGPSLDRSTLTADVCRAGTGWDWDGVRFDMLHPGRDASGENDSSCVLRIHGSGGSVLLTGDIEKRAEDALLARGLPQTDLVVAPHHGSATSSTPAFVEAVKARIAVFSAGYRNRWHFPRTDVVERWRAAGAKVLTTIEGGALEWSVAAEGIQPVREYRRSHARYWHRQPASAEPGP